ncbi:MAG: glycoside hydrolase family 3 C-terminal domain-containing protein [Anaerolineae bacterium]|nr:glycoside hydrolase family 3 C-terminal domain-containing protein [Anaerolineae bacterium]
MTLEEKVSLAAGADMWHSTGVERLGIPPFKMTDGPNGARGGSFEGGIGSACFPVGVCLGSTWNPALVERVGQALGQEVKSKGAHILLAPTVNIHRSPLNGRNFECYSEDPFLTAHMAVAYITGVQSQGVGACVKHFVCNDSEFERQSISSEVGERALREIYLPPFEAAVKGAKTWSLMSSYNKLNGTYCSENHLLLTEILKGEWGFEGAVISDWTGTYSTVGPANGGLDLEMPGPARRMGDKLLQAVKEGLVSEAAIDDKVRRLLRVVFKTGVMEHPEQPEQAIDRPEHRQVIRQAAAEGAVLFKNNGILPLDENKVKRIAVIGPNAVEAKIMGGGSAHVNAHYIVSPLEGIQTRAGDQVEIRYELGCTNHKDIPELKVGWLTPVSGSGTGWAVDYFNNQELEGMPVASETRSSSRIMWFGDIAPGVNKANFSARFCGMLAAPQSGSYTFSLASAGLSRMFIDDQLVIDNWSVPKRGRSFFGMGGEVATVQMDLDASRAVKIVVEYCNRNVRMFGGVAIGCLPALPENVFERAVQAAAEADVALLFVGTSDEWESEGFDRPDMELPGRQVELIEAVAAANPNTVVVLNTGSPVSVPWLDQVAALVEAWFPGQECGNAIADVLFGDVDPSGRLSQTWPMRLEDNPAYINYPGENGKVVYGEGIFVGYRYYDQKKIAPRFPFGYGLSYTTFAYSNLRLDAAEYTVGDPVTVSVDVTNTGQRAGKEVVQVYVRDVACRLARPEKELKGFAKVALQPGETKTVTLELIERAFSCYDDAQKQWVVEPGEFEMLVGASSRDIRAAVRLTMVEPPAGECQIEASTETAQPPVETASSAGLSKASRLRDIVNDPDGKAVLRKHFGAMLDSPQVAMAMDFTLEQIAIFAPEALTPAKVAEIDRDLRAL